MFARPSSVKLVGQYFIMFDCSFHEHDFFCSTDLGAIKHMFNGVLNFRYLYRLVKYRGYGDSGVRLVPSSRVARNTSRPFEIFTAIIIGQNLQLS